MISTVIALVPGILTVLSIITVQVPSIAIVADTSSLPQTDIGQRYTEGAFALDFGASLAYVTISAPCIGLSLQLPFWAGRPS